MAENFLYPHQINQNIPWAKFSPELHIIGQSFINSPYTCLCGLNNSGKSAILKLVYGMCSGIDSIYLGTSRFIGDVNLSSRQVHGGFSRDSNGAYAGNENIDGLNLVLEELVFLWSDERRNAALKACSYLLGNQFIIRLTDPSNSMSPYIITIDDKPLSQSSTGARLTLKIVFELFNEKKKIVFIDEPELGLSPVLQKRLFSFISDKKQRDEFLPHIDSIIVASHSHHFLNKTNITNNYIVTRHGIEINCQQVTSVQELNQLQIELLGNNLDTYLLPAAIILVEGKTDVLFIKRVISLRYPNRNVVVVSSEVGIVQKIRAFNQMIGSNQETPYYARTFVIMDAVHHGVTLDQIERAGVMRGNIIEWNANGIEFVYPADILASIFRCDADAIAKMHIGNGDEITINGITKRKSELAETVTAELNKDCTYPREMHDKLFAPLDILLG